MRAAYEKYQDQGFEVLSVSVQEGDPEVTEFIERHGLRYKFLMDRTGEVSNAYRVVNTPTTYFIAPDGTIADELDGLVTGKWLERNIGAFLKT